MQMFFGFIDYKKDDLYIDNYSQRKDETLLHQKYKNYNLFLSYTKHQQSYLYDDKKILLLFTGNISNRHHLLSELHIENKSLSISQLLKEAYTKWGMKLLEKIEGKFSLIIFNKKDELLTLSKENVGTVPLSFHHSNELVIFGSHISNFKQAPGFNPTISPEGLAVYLQFGYMIQPNTILKDCYKVKAGESNNFDLRKKEQYSSVHWRLEDTYKEKKTLQNESTIITQAEKLLNEAIQNQEVESATIALSLSGGYDSSSLAALVKKQNIKQVETFTIGFKESCINEAPHAKAIAKYLGTKHHEYYFTATDAIRIIPQLCKAYDEPFAAHAASPTILTAELIKEEGLKDLFVGDGGDEVFATADDVQFFKRIQLLPAPLRAILVSPLKKINIDAIPYLKDTYNFPTKSEKLLQMLSARNIAQMTKSRNILFREKELKQLVQGYTKASSTTFDEINFNGFSETVDEIIGTYFKTTMIDGELVKSYSASNYHNIHLHTPFLDKKLIEYLARVPSSIKIKDGIKKYILKEIAYKHIPKELLDRPKSGFDIPFSSWMRQELKELVYAQINEERLNEDNLFYTSSIIKIRDNFYNGNNNYKYKLWRIFLFQLWYENFKG